MMNGEIGMIAGCRVVASRRIDDSKATIDNFIVCLSPEVEDGTPALPAVTIYTKAEAMLENGYVKTVSDDVIEALAYVLNTDFDTVKDACTLVIDNRERDELIDDINIILSHMTEEQLTALLNMLSLFKRQ